MTPEEEVRRAGKADEILRNEVFKEAFAEIEEAILSGIRRAPIKDVELRDKLCQQYVALHTIRDQLRTYIESGKLANASLAERIRGALR
jgi:hypothetical protein